MQLYPYQVEAINKIRDKYRQGKKKILLVSPTGTGKTVIFCEICKSASERNKSVIIVVHGQDLVMNAFNRLRSYGVKCDYIMGAHKFDPNLNVYVVSSDTLVRRKKIPNADLVIIDEAHQCANKTYKSIADAYEGSLFLCVTATPYQKGSIRHIAEDHVVAIELEDAIEENYLSDYDYIAPVVHDLSGVKITAGEFNSDELENFMSKPTIIGCIVENYRKFSDGKTAICFATTVAHSIAMAEYFTENGIPAMHADANTPIGERLEIIEKLKKKEILVICNVNIFSTGVDIPCLDTIIMARPTKSSCLYLQQIGRGTRIYPGKEKFTVLDHANNFLIHGLPKEDRKIDIDGKTKKRKEGETTKQCPECLRVIDKTDIECPHCGHSFEKEESGRSPIEMVDGEMMRIEKDDMIRIEAMSKRDSIYFFWKKRGLSPKNALRKTINELQKKYSPCIVEFAMPPGSWPRRKEYIASLRQNSTGAGMEK